ncbi:TPA: hypothetical protein SLG40_000244 [Serratia odorifera]|nr:hypothetical protein [Serratia odorifera]
MRMLIFILCMLVYLLLLGYLGAYVTDKICEQSSSYSKVCRMVDVSEPHIASEQRPLYDK